MKAAGPKRLWSAWYLLLAAALILSVQSIVEQARTATLLYSEFKLALHAGKVDDLVLAEQEVAGTLRTAGLDAVLPAATLARLGKGDAERRFVALRVADPALVGQLEAAKVRYAAAADKRWLSSLLSWVLPALIFFALYSVFLKRMGGAAGGLLEIGKSRAKVFMQQSTGVSFEDVAGVDEAKEELMEIVSFLKTPERYRRLGARIPKGVLIVGAPGTGKTLLAKAVAGQAGVPFFSISGAGFVEMFVGVGAARVRDLFEQAEGKAPCIIFIDELDALGKARGVTSFGGHDEREQTLNQLLVEMDGFDSNKGVLILAATNRPEILDPALLRPGRFDRHIALDRPDLKGRRQILQVHARLVKLAADVDLTALAARSAGFAGADLANLVNEAALRAGRVGKDEVAMADFEQAFERIVGGLEKKGRVMSALEKETVAYHEAGHALVAEFRPRADRVSRISIIPRGVAALGYTQQTPSEDRYLLRKSELLQRLDVLLGGRVAEEEVFGDVSTGAQNDLQRATDMAREMVSQYGMSAELGPLSFERRGRGAFLGTLGALEPAEYGLRTALLIDRAMRELLADSYERVRATLREHRPLLDALARRLLAAEVVERAELDQILAAQQGAEPGKPCGEDLAADSPPWR
ncbi:cell division protein FtsH [Janthinobacterium sp. BJB412]|nr:cell division protein FtsH [Janthinobacterium sp. BJB412]